jgi:hypothetical protein
MEQVYKQPGKRFRPFSQSAEVTCRGSSLTLQRAVADFGADHSFGRVSDKLREHYGITLPTSTVRNITETHAWNMYDKNQKDTVVEYPTDTGRNYVIAETDGCLVPIVNIDQDAEDKRKGKKHVWKEARLCLAHAPGEVTLQFGGEFQEGVDKAGEILFDRACRSGFGNTTYLHAAGRVGSMDRRRSDSVRRDITLLIFIICVNI